MVPLSMTLDNLWPGYQCHDILGEYAFSYAEPVVWNSLTVNIRDEPDIDRFKKILGRTF